MLQSSETEENLNQSLINACREHQLQKIISLLQLGANPNFVSFSYDSHKGYGESRNPLSCALETGVKGSFQQFKKVIVTLLENGADPNDRVCKYAEKYPEDLYVCNFIVERLKDFNQIDNKIDIVSMFVGKGMDINSIQQVEKSKNGRNGIKWRTCMIFQIMDNHGIVSKLQQLSIVKSEILVLAELEKKREEQLWELYTEQIFNNSFQRNPVKKQPVTKETLKIDPYDINYLRLKLRLFDEQDINRAKNQLKETKLSKTNQQLILALLQLGADPNSQYYYMHKFGTDYETKEQTLLHRAIMNNSDTLTKVLLQKGVNPLMKCKVLTDRLKYPESWTPEEKIKKKCEKETELKLALQKRQQGQHQDQQQMRKLDFKIYKLQNYIIDNDLPNVQLQVVEIDSIQLAELCNIRETTINLLKEKAKQFEQALKTCDY